ncbi:MAG TPA: hypothetical protein EYH30_04745 [Anaerolineales bacterium]|nr:hypothetical protein [Anaerolineae bacterium]HIQ01423.1 hypothetical protein [Anaerolineales bacterium]
MSRSLKPAVITAAVTVDASPAQVRRWFRSLEAHPERYRFDTHAGFTFVQGRFGQVGARFQTGERFYGLKLMLTFELTVVDEAGFRFRLIRPLLPIWGAFLIGRGPGGTTSLRLEVGAIARLGVWLLRLPPVRKAVQRQIRREVEHIKASVEAVYPGINPAPPDCGGPPGSAGASPPSSPRPSPDAGGRSTPRR